MSDIPTTRGSPSNQLAAFTTPGLDVVGRRGNPVSLSGTGTIRPVR